ncbi:MAG: ABC transporter substrate-binding protein [Thiotrichales bacterium]|nr:ABC transporter substrate-binding protein [Thiotrichales bacterium]
MMDKQAIRFSIAAVLGILWLAFGLNMTAQAAVKINQEDPGQMVQQISEQIITQLDKKREVMQNNPDEVIKFAEDYLLPYVAQDKMARFVMGVHWRTATDAQRQAFIDAFTKNLIRSYSGNFLKLNVISATVDQVREPQPRRAEITSTIKLKDGQAVQVVYRAFQEKDQKVWQLYDFTFNNISTLVSFRNVYGVMIDQQGIDAVIQNLQKNESTVLEKSGN